MRSLFTSLRALFVGALVLGLGACDNPGAPSEDGTFSLKLIDAPGDFKTAHVTIEKIYLQGENGETVLMDQPVAANLLDLQNVTLDLVKDKSLPAGTYTQLRIITSGGYIEVEQDDGSHKVFATSPEYAQAHGVIADGTLQMPSFAQTGLKVNLPGGGVTVDGSQNIVLLDFNVAETFIQPDPTSGQWVMQPSIKASDFAMTGSVTAAVSLDSGVTLPQLADGPMTLDDVTALLDKGGDVIEVPLADADGDGVFEAQFKYLDAGDYTVDFKSEVALTYDVVLPHTVTVTSGSDAKADFLVKGW